MKDKYQMSNTSIKIKSKLFQLMASAYNAHVLCLQLIAALFLCNLANW